jgi:hypothetical protein
MTAMSICIRWSATSATAQEFELNPDRTIKRPQSAMAYNANYEAIRQGDLKVVSGNMYNIAARNHIEDTIVTGGVESELKSELQRWWNDDVVMAAGSFTRPTFQIGWAGKTVSEFDLYPAWESSPSITIDNHYCSGWSTIGDFVTLKVNVLIPGIYSPLINFKGGNAAAGATARLTVGTHSVEHSIANNWNETFPNIELLPGEQELTFEIISKTGTGAIVDELKSAEFTYVGAGSIGAVGKDLHKLNISRSRVSDAIQINVNDPGNLSAKLYNHNASLVHTYLDGAVSAGQIINIPLSLPVSVPPGVYTLEIKQAGTLRVITLEK